MKKDVFIRIKGIQQVDDEKDTTELFTQGNFYRRNNCYYITYEESETTGFAGCKTTLKIEGERKVTLLRSGSYRSHLIIENGERNFGHYGTEAGDIVLGVNARQIRSQLTDEGGELYFSYSLDINSTLLSENEVCISVQEDPAQ